VRAFGQVLIVLAPCVFGVGSAARADVFLLHSGGQVHGQLVNADQNPRKTYVIKTASGGQVELDAEQVKKVERQNAAELRYDQIRANYPDTVDGQWQLAEWCRDNKLTRQRRTHLARIIELDPDHAAARRSLGYSNINGRWITQEKLMAENGYVRYKGAWLLPQEVELKEQERKEKLAQTEWSTKLKRWHGWLGTDKADQALAGIKGVNDPMAAPALARYLIHSKQEPRDLRLLYVEALGRLNDAAGMDALITASLLDADEEVRLTSLDQIVDHNYKPAVSKYVQALRHKENAVVNRAAVCLSRMKDKTAIGPLIEALVTIHRFEIQKGNPGQTSASFGRGPGGGGGGFTFGGGGTEIINQPIENREVLNALTGLSSANFDYDKHAWKRWYAAQKKGSSLDARRDSSTTP
jgi:hypothetical protein